ncbi:MAG: hypothetical protein LLG16_00915 [Euryarchaeota archaeon]|nr:hypothetical protein [Euryarchaeota archaeon]
MRMSEIPSKVSPRISKLSWLRKILLLLAITLLIYGPASAYFLSNSDGEHDHDLYRARTQTIIDGGWTIGLILIIIGTTLICDADRIGFKSDAFVTKTTHMEEVVR